MNQLYTAEAENKKQRYDLLDTIRGITLLSMICYHGAWDFVYLYQVKWDWYRGTGAYIWQQSICWTFIFLSGFCWSLGKRHLKRGLMVFGGGLLVTLVTILVMPDNRVVFGVLTLYAAYDSSGSVFKKDTGAGRAFSKCFSICDYQKY